MGKVERPKWAGAHESKRGQRASFKFNIRAFHDAVLELGSVPLPVVTARIDRFITENGKGPYPDME
jgi:uncharacterized protein (DUF885 family)